jgi:hypothetical protein
MEDLMTMPLQNPAPLGARSAIRLPDAQKWLRAAGSIVVGAAAVGLITMAAFQLRLNLTTDPQNWFALAAFEYCALVVSRLSGRAASQTAVATRQREETERLYEVSRLVLLMDGGRDPGPQLTALIQRVFRPAGDSGSGGFRI